MIWQELIVSLVVGLAVVSLYRHLRGMVRIAKPGSEPSCHGCDDCGDASGTVTPTVELGDRRSR